MKTSDEGIRLIKGFEGYHKKLANGDCTAYQTFLGTSPTGKKLYDIPTLGYGCTVGIKMGMVWSEERATEELKKEVAKHEDYVTQYVTVPINQNEFDALVSFSYNCGSGNLKKLIEKRLNKGDRTATAQAFLLYVKAQGKTLPGLVSRRTREAALFQKPVEEPAEPFMPQVVTKEAEPPSRKTVAAVAVSAATGVAQFMPADPIGSVETALKTGQRVRGISDQSHGLYSWASAGVPLSALLAVGACVGGYYLLCHVLPKKTEAPQ